MQTDFHFNSHAHVERDSSTSVRKPTWTISTHTLTWSVTDALEISKNDLIDFNSHAHVERDLRKLKQRYKLSKISTHTLTWSVTPQRRV